MVSESVSGRIWPKLAPGRPLILPVQAGEHPAQRALGDGLPPHRELEPQHLLLDVGGEEQEVHQLGQPGAGEPVAAGDVGVVLVPAGLDIGGDALGGERREPQGELAMRIRMMADGRVLEGATDGGGR